LSLCGAIDDLRAFLIIPVTENNASTDTDDALGVRYTRVNMAWFFQNTKGDSFSSSVSLSRERYAATSCAWNKICSITTRENRAVLNFARFDSLVYIVARSRKKSRSLSLVPFLARYRSLSLSLTGLGLKHKSAPQAIASGRTNKHLQ